MAKKKRRKRRGWRTSPRRKESYCPMGMVLVKLLIALLDPAGTTPTEKTVLLP